MHPAHGNTAFPERIINLTAQSVKVQCKAAKVSSFTICACVPCRPNVADVCSALLNQRTCLSWLSREFCFALSWTGTLDSSGFGRCNPLLVLYHARHATYAQGLAALLTEGSLI